MQMMVREGFSRCMRLSAYSTKFKINKFYAISAANHKRLKAVFETCDGKIGLKNSR